MERIEYKEIRESITQLPRPLMDNNWKKEKPIELVKQSERFLFSSREFLKQNSNFKGDMRHEIMNRLVSNRISTGGYIDNFAFYEEYNMWNKAHNAECKKMLEGIEADLFWSISFMEAIAYKVKGETLSASQLQASLVSNSIQQALNNFRKLQSVKILPITSEIKPDIIKINIGVTALLVKNIVQNALKHGQADTINWQTSETDTHINWELSDNGSGIDQQHLPHIFKEGFSGGGSTGIGLGQAPEKLAQFGATIRAEANGGLPNKDGGNGAKFVIELSKT